MIDYPQETPAGDLQLISESVVRFYEVFYDQNRPQGLDYDRLSLGNSSRRLTANFGMSCQIL